MSLLSISVIVPTYQRPDYLESCVRSIFAQTLPPQEIILVSRDSDTSTNNKIQELQTELQGLIPIISPQVSEPGFLPPLRLGMSIASCDIVVFFDDDAEAFPDWLERLVAHYSDPQVAGVGGRCITYYMGELLQYSPADKAATVTWYGEAIGNMYRDLTFSSAISATHLMGGNSSYRRDVLLRVGIDPYLNKDVAYGWELDLGLTITGMGYRLVFDPEVKVNHFTAPREKQGMRPGHDLESVYYMVRNNTYTMCKHLAWTRRLIFGAYTFLVGRRSSLGVLSFFVCITLSFSRQLLARFRVTMQGKLAGWRDAATWRQMNSMGAGIEK